MKRSIRSVLVWGLVTAVVSLVMIREADARIALTEDLEISGSLFHFGEFRYGGKQGPEVYALFTNEGAVLTGFPFSNQDKYANVNAFRTELTLEALYKGIPHFTPVIKLRPYFDAAFEWEQKPDEIERFWESNFHDGNLNDRWDPLVREAFVDIAFHPLFIRAGRQLITWGRSDGVVVLDFVNPNNLRNPLTFEQERFRIPTWMLNTVYDFSDMPWVPGGIQKELQVIWNMHYVPTRFPGFTPQEEGLHPWTVNVVDFANQVINTSNFLFEQTNFFDNYTYNRGDSFFEQSEVFVRWFGRIGEGLGEPLRDFTYSIHYGHVFNDIPIYQLNDRIDAGLAIDIAGPRTPTSGGIDFVKKRYDFVGASFDKALMFLPGQFEGTVLRAEGAFNFANFFYDPDLENRRHDNITYLIGLDQYLYLAPRSVFETPWFVSFQFWQDWILDRPIRGEFTNLDSPACALQPGCGKRGYIDIGAFNLFNGLRQQQRSVLTLFMFNDFLPGKTLHVELFGLQELEQQGTWFRALVGYSFTTALSARLGTNQVWGPRDTFFGQFKKNDHFFTEVKYTF